jgi:flagellar motility protein MotE (MotC chaperone)
VPARIKPKQTEMKTVAPLANGPAPADPDPAGEPTAPPAEASEIITGATDAVQSTRHLSDQDESRLAVAGGQRPHPAENAPAATIPESDLAQRYCVSVTDAAADARIAWQKAKLAEAEQEIDKRIAALDAKTTEYKTWLERRDEFSRRATNTLVQIYARMEPDSAALQLVAMDEETAAAVLAKLDPRSSSAILNEMQADKAARLTATIAGAARVATMKKAAAQAAAAHAGAVPVQAKQGGRTQ